MEPQSSSNDDPPDTKPRTGKAQRPATGWSRSRCCRPPTSPPSCCLAGCAAPRPSTPQPRGRHRPRRHDRDPSCRPARRRARRGRRSRRPHPAGRRPPLRRPHPPRLTNPGTGGTAMPRHHHTSSRGGRHRRAVLVTALLRRLVGRRRQHRWHRPHSGGQSRARGRWAQPSRRTRRRGRLRARWSR